MGEPRRILVTGASGLIGSALLRVLHNRGDDVARLVRLRSPMQNDTRFWDPAQGMIELPLSDDYDVVVHLAGENLGEKRLTAKRKQAVWNSRVAATTLLCDALARLNTPPRVLISASAMGIYGDRGDEVLTEASAPGTGYLAELCQAWEAATEPIKKAGSRVVHPRMGLVLSAAGGALTKMLPAFRFGVGGPLAGGTQWTSWMTRDDVVRSYLHLIDHAELSGPVNLATSAPVRQKEFAQALGKALHRPAIFPVPRAMMETVFGKDLSDSVLASIRMVPVKLQQSGFSWTHPNLAEGLHHAVHQDRTK